MQHPLVSDPLEQIVQLALEEANIQYDTDHNGGTTHHLDFHLPDYNIAIEVKRFHSDRIAEQMSRHPQVIAVQGLVAVTFLAQLITRSKGKL